MRNREPGDPQERTEFLLGQIADKLENIRTTLEFLTRHYTKLMWGLLGLCAATLGVKLVGTPLWGELALTFCLVVACVAAGMVFERRRGKKRVKRGLWERGPWHR